MTRPMQRETLGREHPGPAAMAAKGVRAYSHHNRPLRRLGCKRKSEGDDARARPPTGRAWDDNSLGMRVDNVDPVEPAGDSAQALAADVGTLLNEELLTRVETRPSGRILVRREKADDTPQEGCSGNR